MEKEKLQKINSQQELDELIEKNNGYPLECFVNLRFGLRSSKDIELNAYGDYTIFNECDDSEEMIPHEELMNSYIGEAISKGALYKY